MIGNKPLDGNPRFVTQTLYVLMVTNGLFMASTYAFIALASPIARLLHLSAWQIGTLISMVGVLWVFSANYWGKKSDCCGRLYTLKQALLGFTVACGLLSVYICWALFQVNQSQGLAPSVWLTLSIFLLVRLIIGWFSAGIPVSITAWVADNLSENNRKSALAKINAFGAIGMIVAPPLAGVFGRHALGISFFVFAILPALALPMLHFSKTTDNPKANQQANKLAIRDARIFKLWLINLIALSSIIIVNECLGFYLMDQLRLTPHQVAPWIGYILALAGLAFIVAQMLLIKFKQITAKRWLYVGTVLTMLGFIMPLFAQSALMVMLGYAIAGSGMGFVLPMVSVLAMNAVHPMEQGSCAATMTTAQGFALIIAPVLGTAIYDLNHHLPFLLVVMCLGIMPLLLTGKILDKK